MNKRTCLYCAHILDNDKRGDAKFCNDECRYKYRNEKQKQKAGEEKPLNGLQAPAPVPALPPPSPLVGQLRGIVETPKPLVPQIQMLTETTKTESQAYLAEKQRNESLKAALKQVEADLAVCVAKIERLKQDYGWLLYPALLLTGVKLGEGMAPKSHSQAGAWCGAGLGLLAALAINRASADNGMLQKKKMAEMQEYQAMGKQLQALKTQAQGLVLASNLVLFGTPQFITTTVQKPVLLLPPKQPQEQAATPAPENNGLAAIVPPLTPAEKQPRMAPVPENSKIINSLKLKDIAYQALDFKGNWLSFFGQPSTNFHCVIHGLPGQGKSYFSLLFAKYLADCNGSVIYVSGEEGHSKTMRDKVLHNQSASEDLDIADFRNYEELVNGIAPDTYNFIFMDSLNNLRIDADKMKALRERYKNSALITICQSTKDGKMRGSNEIAHDADITVEVKKGIATTTKNRFKEIDMTFEVFNKNNTGGGPQPLRGTI